jgi:membrane-bound metal-dependent hydrolase YbcI (DUF457 family)
MAGFRTHITTSTVLGIGYGSGAYLLYGVPLSTSCLAGGLCSVAGMLPDLDSDSGVPLRETLAFAAAIVPMLLLPRFARLGLDHDSMAVITMLLYLLIRFPISKLIKRSTVHRGMFHSLPACAIFAELTFLLCSGNDVSTRLFKASGLALGFMSHLVLDEIWAVNFRFGIPRLKSSFGTAIKFWGTATGPNLFSWACVALLTFLTVDGRIYEGDVAPYVRAFQIGHTSVASTPEGESSAPKVDGSEGVESATRADQSWNR